MSGNGCINKALRRLNNDHCRNFFQKYTNENISNESTMPKYYLNDYYDLTVRNIQENITDNYVWTSVDETIDVTGRNIANLIIGKMCEDIASRPYLLACKQLDNTNYATVARFVNTVLQIL